MAKRHPQFTIADRVVAWFSPVAAVRRAHARTVLSYYEAAKPDRLHKNRRSTGSANDEVLRAGASLDSVGAVLRHQSPDTTAHYAKVDVQMLREIAQPWPGGASC